MSVRTKNIKKNILFSAVFKALNILIYGITVSYTFNNLEAEKYGVWVTIYSIVNWFNLLDFGLGNGFRNKFAEAIAINNKSNIEKYVKVLYSSTFFISLAFISFFVITNLFLDWNKILNLSKAFNENINNIVFVVFLLFSIQLFVKNVSFIFLGLQKVAVNDCLVLVSNTIVLLGLFFLNNKLLLNLNNASWLFMSIPILINSVATYFVFKDKLKIKFPTISLKIDKLIFSELMTLGIKFFIIQIATLIIYSSSNIIISNLFGASKVGVYNVGFQLFAVSQVLFSVIVTPYWSAFTEANALNDKQWIINSIKKLKQIWLLFVIGIILLWLISPFVFKIWIGDFSISRWLTLQFAFYAILITGVAVFSSYLAGTGKLHLTYLNSIIQTILFLPLTYLLSKFFELELIGVILSVNLNLFISLLIYYVQTKKNLNETATGFWLK